MLPTPCRHPNLYADVSWDVLSKQLLMNFDPAVHNVSKLHQVHQNYTKS